MKNELVRIEQSETRLQIHEQTKELIKASIAPNTEKAYKDALARLHDFLNGNALNDGNLATYITYLHGEGKSPSTISQVVAAVKWTHKQQRMTTDLPITNATLSGIRRDGKARGRGQVDGLIWKDVERVCIACELDNTKAGYRDSALIRLMSDCLLRVSEVVSVNCGHIRGKTLHIPSSKTDTEGKGVSLYITDDTREIIGAYREMADIRRGSMFRHIRRGDHVQPSRLHSHSARRIIQKRAKAVGIENFISGHSLRVGTAVSLAQAGASVVDMQVAGRWKSSQMPAHYAKAELAERGAIARYKDQKK
ncbi:MAG: tyrosine-type recombinase/integrase [Paracoccaceae bacterium]|nr:tyrosine-type recombinase/integrase [Paracoccaceae bacterium]